MRILRAAVCRCERCFVGACAVWVLQSWNPDFQFLGLPLCRLVAAVPFYPLLDTAKVQHFSLCSKFRASNSAVLMKNLSKSLTLGKAHARMVLPSLNRRLHSLTSSSLLTLGITQASLVLLSLNRRLHSFIFNVGRTNSSNSFASERPIRSIIYIYIL